MAKKNILQLIKQEKDAKYKYPIFKYEILGFTPLMINFKQTEPKWFEFDGYLNYNNKSGNWSIQIKDKNSLDYYRTKYSNKDPKIVLNNLLKDKFSKLDYIRNVQFNMDVINNILN